MGRRGEGYVLVQFLLLALIALSGRQPQPAAPTQKRLGAVLLLGGLVLALSSGWQLGRNLTPWPQPVAGGTLETGGPYRWVRHPIYSALLLLAAGWSLLRGSRSGGAWTAALGVLFELKSQREEAELLKQFPEYADYQRRVKKFLPGVY